MAKKNTFGAPVSLGNIKEAMRPSPKWQKKSHMEQLNCEY